MIFPKVSQNILGHDIAQSIPKYLRPDRWWSSTTSHELYAMVPPETYFGGIFNFGIFPTIIAFFYRHWCNWLKGFIGILVLASIKCNYS